MKKLYRKHIFFRNDDVWRLDAKLKRLVGLFITNNIPLHLAVIPDKLTLDCCSYLKGLIRRHPDLIEIGQHGYKHENYSQDKFRKYEFGDTRSFKQQLSDIHKGREEIEESFGIKPSVFIPPWDMYDFQTLRALKIEGFSILCADRKHRVVYPGSGLRNVCVSKYWNKKKRDGSWLADGAAKSLVDVLSCHETYVGVEMHHARNTPGEIRELSRFIRILKTYNQIRFIHLSKAPGIILKNSLDQEALFYYLMFQFAPKGFSLVPGVDNSVHKDYNFNIKRNITYFSGQEKQLQKKIYRSLSLEVEKLLSATRGPLGILLSGGIDSAALLHVVREVTERKIHAITGYYFSSDKQVLVAKKLARHYGATHRQLLIDADSLEKLREIYAISVPQPIGDNGLLPTYLMIKELTPYSRLILSGDGADCLFAGLNTTRPAEFFLTSKERRSFFPLISAQSKQNNPLLALLRWVNVKDPAKRQVVINLQFLVKNRVDYLLCAARACDSKIILPYLEKDFVRLALSIPASYLIKGRQRKYILRKMFEEKLPGYCRGIEKTGFSPPFLFWYNLNRDLVIRTLVKAVRLGVPMDYIKYLIRILPFCRSYEEGMKIWLVLNLVFWAEQNTEIIS